MKLNKVFIQEFGQNNNIKIGRRYKTRQIDNKKSSKIKKLNFDYAYIKLNYPKKFLIYSR